MTTKAYDTAQKIPRYIIVICVVSKDDIWRDKKGRFTVMSKALQDTKMDQITNHVKVTLGHYKEYVAPLITAEEYAGLETGEDTRRIRDAILQAVDNAMKRKA